MLGFVETLEKTDLKVFVLFSVKRAGPRYDLSYVDW